MGDFLFKNTDYQQNHLNFYVLYFDKNPNLPIKNMFRLIPILILLLSFSTFAQNIKVRSAGNGKVRITSGKTQSIINLSKDMAGCLMTYDITDPKRRKFDSTSFDLIDSVKKDGSIYVVLLGGSGGNCNVQGQCGASESSTLFWLKLSQTLKVQAKQIVIPEDCLDDINLTDDSLIKMNKGVLSFEFEDNLYRQTLDYTVTKLIYKHSEPEKGFDIKTEKRDRPKN